MKKIFLMAAFGFFSLASTAQSKVGTIDADFILSKMPEMIEIEEGVKTYNTELQEDLQKSIEEYEGLVAEYQENNASYGENVKKEKENQIIGLENEIKGFRQKASVMMQMKRNDLTKPLYQKIDEAMLKVVEAEGYTQILNASSNNLAFSDASFDITDKVLEELQIPVEQ